MEKNRVILPFIYIRFSWQRVVLIDETHSADTRLTSWHITQYLKLKHK